MDDLETIDPPLSSLMRSTATTSPGARSPTIRRISERRVDLAMLVEVAGEIVIVVLVIIRTGG